MLFLDRFSNDLGMQGRQNSGDMYALFVTGVFLAIALNLIPKCIFFDHDRANQVLFADYIRKVVAQESPWFEQFATPALHEPFILGVWVYIRFKKRFYFFLLEVVGYAELVLV
jgi:hypothetical protein